MNHCARMGSKNCSRTAKGPDDFGVREALAEAVSEALSKVSGPSAAKCFAEKRLGVVWK